VRLNDETDAQALTKSRNGTPGSRGLRARSGAVVGCLAVVACTSIVGLPDLPDAPETNSGKGGNSGAGSGSGGSLHPGTGGMAGAGGRSAGGSAALQGGASGASGASGATGDVAGMAGDDGSNKSSAGETNGRGGTHGGSGSANDAGSSGAGDETGASSGRSGTGGASSGGSGATAGTGGGGTAGTGGRGVAGTGGGTAGTGGGTAGTGGGTAGTGGVSTGSSGCGKSASIPSGTHIAISAGGIERRYILRVPDSYDNASPYRLIIAFHQHDGSDDQMDANGYYHLLPLAGETAIFVAPNGQQNSAGCTQASGCSWPNTGDTDLALVDAIVAELQAGFCIDTSRIFVTGWSIGGAMAYRTACSRALDGSVGYVRAAAVYSGGALSGTCNPTKPVAYYASHGTVDSIISYDKGVALAQTFASVDGCSWTTPTLGTSGSHACTSEPGCATGYPVKFCSFVGDHTPDPIDPPGPKSWEYQTVWDFLSQF
jgi:poly(3-hydroxybutyrate) depolymerase